MYENILSNMLGCQTYCISDSPSLRQLNLMAHYKDSINDALKYIGAKPLASAWFWSSTESSQYNAWYVYFFIGDTGSYSKYGSGRVRAVIDF